MSASTNCPSPTTRGLRTVLIPLGWVLLAATAIALRNSLPDLVFNEAGRWRLLTIRLAIFVAMGLIVLGSIRIADHLFRRFAEEAFWKKMLAGTALIALSLALFTYTVYPHLIIALVGRPPTDHFYLWEFCTLVGALVYVCVLLQRASHLHAQRGMQLQREADQLASTLAQAELSLLETQIEPHFLFNTLAHIKYQYRVDDTAAEQMLSALIAYLERALPALRRADWTLGDEMDLIEVYLSILEPRFRPRLAYRISVAASFRRTRLPALTIVTLVENAVRHGLSPKPEGGVVTVSATREEAFITISVCDDGVGLRQHSGSGLGLASIKARLQTAFGGRAELVVAPAQPCGVLATVRIPWEGQDAPAMRH